ESNYLRKRLSEQAAREMKLDSAEIRRRNFIRPEQFPYRTHVDDWYDAGEFARVLDQALAAADWKGFDARRAEARRRGRVRGGGGPVLRGGGREGVRPPPRGSRAPGPVARPRPCLLPGMDRRADPHRDRGYPGRRRRHGKRLHRYAGDGAGVGDDLHTTHYREDPGS